MQFRALMKAIAYLISLIAIAMVVSFGLSWLDDTLGSPYVLFFIINIFVLVPLLVFVLHILYNKFKK